MIRRPGMPAVSGDSGRPVSKCGEGNRRCSLGLTSLFGGRPGGRLVDVYAAGRWWSCPHFDGKWISVRGDQIRPKGSPARGLGANFVAKRPGEVQ
ncbi:uncharacterized protein RHO17_022604 isoform 2-T4 [Thomomys bottae]